MSKKTLLWFLLLVLALLIFFCIKSKLADMPQPDNKINTSPLKVEKAVEVKKELPKKVKKIDKIKKKDISFKIDKNDKELSIEGVLPSKNDFYNLLSKYNNLKSRNLKFDKNVENIQVLSLILDLNNILEKFKRGYIEYHDKRLIVNGVVASKEDKELVEATINSIKSLEVESNIVVEEPKSKIEHIGKLSITKQGDNVTISGIFTSQKEIDSLVELLKSKDLDVKKELCIVDSDLKEDRWKIPFVLVVDDFVEFIQGTIQFDKDAFSIIGETDKEGIKEDVDERLEKIDEDINITNDITFIQPKSNKQKLQEKVNSILKLKSLRFVTGTGTLLNESKPILDEVANILLKNPNVKVEIAGYTDSDGDEKTNLILSQHRADTVRKYLIKKGVNPKNLKAIGYGEANPLVENNSEENKQINRRVEFIILGE
jgi:outer membrane protein OmpA-like peptidoglycan-associated protein